MGEIVACRQMLQLQAWRQQGVDTQNRAAEVGLRCTVLEAQLKVLPCPKVTEYLRIISC